MTEVEKVVRMIKPLWEPLCVLPVNPADGDTFTCRRFYCMTSFEAVAVDDGRVLWIATDGDCLHPFEHCSVVDGSVSIGFHCLLGAYECHDCGEWVVPLGEPLLFA